MLSRPLWNVLMGLFWCESFKLQYQPARQDVPICAIVTHLCVNKRSLHDWIWCHSVPWTGERLLSVEVISLVGNSLCLFSYIDTASDCLLMFVFIPWSHDALSLNQRRLQWEKVNAGIQGSYKVPGTWWLRAHPMPMCLCMYNMHTQCVYVCVPW